MSDFRGGGGVYNFWIIKGKNRIKGGRGVKNDSKKSDIIYERSLSQNDGHIVVNHCLQFVKFIYCKKTTRLEKKISHFF